MTDRPLYVYRADPDDTIKQVGTNSKYADIVSRFRGRRKEK